MYRAGFKWTQSGDGWSTIIDKKFVIQTWEFGTIHQVKVFVDNQDGVGLPYGSTRDVAMRRGVNWVKSHKRNGPPSPEKVFKDCYESYPTLFRTESDVINQLFFVIGNGYGWIDGAIMCTSIELPQRREAARRRRVKDSLKLTYQMSESTKKIFEELSAKDPSTKVLFEELTKASEKRRKADDELPIGPLLEPDGPRRFYPVSENYSMVCTVPDNVRPEWLALAKRAAQMLYDRSTPLPESREIRGYAYLTQPDDHFRQSENRKLAVKIIESLNRRFPENATQEARL